MKAIVYPKYGSPDVLELKEVEKPTPKDNEVLIRVLATSVNPADWHRMRGTPFLVRLSEGLFKPKKPILGADVAGRVEAVGSKIKLFKPATIRPVSIKKATPDNPGIASSRWNYQFLLFG